MKKLGFQYMIVPVLIAGLFLFVFSSCQGNTARAGETATTDTLPPVKRPHVNKGSFKGTLSFKANGQAYEADPAHVKCFSNAQTPIAMLMATGSDGLQVSVQINNANSEGTYKIDGDKAGSTNITLGGKTYWVQNASQGHYLTVTITKTKKIGSVVLLNGTFEGVMEDREGNKITVTDGQFTTEFLF